MLWRYAVRSLAAQGLAALPTVTAVFLSVAVVSAISLITYNVACAVVSSGREDNLVVRARGADTFNASQLPVSLLGQLRALPGLETSGTQEIAGAEMYATVRVHRLDTGLPAELVLHGVDPIGYTIHPNVHLISGALPAAGTPGVLVGVQRLDAYEGVALNGHVRVGRELWPIVGTFEARGTVYESELWCDREALAATMQKTTFNVFVARAGGAAGMKAAIDVASAVREPRLEAESEATYNRRRASALWPYLDVAWILTVVLMIGTVFACVGTVQALLASRRRELATLIAIGFTPVQICWMLAWEIILLVGVGAVAGAATTLPQIGRAVAFKDWNLVVRIEPALVPILHGALVAGVVALVGIAIAVVQTRRLVVLEALREA